MDTFGNESVLLPDIWGVVIKHTNLYDTIFIRASSKWLNKLCKVFRPFPKYHVLDQRKCMAYLIENGSTSCLDYAKNALHFEWTINETKEAVRCGQVSALKHLVANGCPFHENRALVDCTQYKCSLDMLKYLIERGITWQSQLKSGSNYKSYKNFISDMAMNGHIDCIKYALETGCTDRKVLWTKSMECLEFIVQNQFDWKGEATGPYFEWRNRENICEYAAGRGNLPLLQYAHQSGAPLNGSAYLAAHAGRLECLKYAMEHCEDKDFIPNNLKTIECFKYLLEKFGREKMEARISWLSIGSDIDYLKYILSLGIPLPIADELEFNTLLSASDSTMEVVKFLFDVVPVEKMQRACRSLGLDQVFARRGNIAGLELLFERNMAATTIEFHKMAGAAVLSDDLDTVKFVWEKYTNKEGYDIQETLPDVGYITPEILDFFVEKGAELTDEHLLEAVNVGNLPVTAYLARRGCRVNFDELPPNYFRSLCVKYLLEHPPD